VIYSKNTDVQVIFNLNSDFTLYVNSD